MPIQAIILAAGFGRRMQPLSHACHKALLPVAGSTILGRIVDSLLAIAVTDIIVATGYRADEVRAFCADTYPGVTFTFVHNERYATTNNIVSLSLALDRARPDADVLTIECDLLFDVHLLGRLAGGERGNVALVDRYRTGMDGTVVEVDRRRRDARLSAAPAGARLQLRRQVQDAEHLPLRPRLLPVHASAPPEHATHIRSTATAITSSCSACW